MEGYLKSIWVCENEIAYLANSSTSHQSFIVLEQYLICCIESWNKIEISYLSIQYLLHLFIFIYVFFLGFWIQLIKGVYGIEILLILDDGSHFYERIC